MKPTALVYSSHERCDYIHREFIVQRALESWDNKTLLHLPMSQKTRGGQDYDFGCFRWYYEQFRQYGLAYYPFYWDDNLKKEDVDLLFDMLYNSQVVVLGGGNTFLGMSRYKALGEMHYGNRDLFGKILHERQNRGLITVGFSAGADQLGEYVSQAIDYDLDDPHGFGLARNIVTTLHHEPGRENAIYRLANSMQHCMAFGLPNDSGVAVDQGYLNSGNIWQVIWFVIDKSWDIPKDQWHIKTRQGVKIEHFYPNGQHWSFNGGDKMARVMSPDNNWQNAIIITNQGEVFDYWSQQPSDFGSIEEFLSHH